MIKDLEQEEAFKYLGTDESNRIQQAAMKDKIRKECYWRVQAILKTEHNSANHREVINTVAITIVTFIIKNWTIPEIRRLDM